MGHSELLATNRVSLRARLYDAVVETELWVASAVTSLCAFVCVHLGLEFEPTTLGIVFSSTLLIYNLDNALDLSPLTPADSAEAAAWLGRSARRAKWLALTSLAALLVLCARSRWQTTLLVVSGAGLACLYAVPLGSRGFCLKAVPGIKSLVVGGGVAIAVVGVPLVEQATTPSAAAFSALAMIFVLSVANATLFDIRDIDQDRVHGLRTLPVWLGVTRVRVGLFACVTLASLLIGALDRSLAPSVGITWTALAPLIVWLGPDSPRAAYACLVDGTLLLPWLSSLGSYGS